MTTNNTVTKKIRGITPEEENIYRKIALHYNLKSHETSKVFKQLLADVDKHNLLDKIDRYDSEDNLGVPISVVNHLARDKYLSDVKTAKAEEEAESQASKTETASIFNQKKTAGRPKKTASEYPKSLKIAKWVIDEIEAGEPITNNKIRTTQGCDYKTAKIVMEAIENNYIPKNERLAAIVNNNKQGDQ